MGAVTDATLSANRVAASPSPRVRVARGRLLLLAAGGFALFMGLWTGLARAGVHAAVGPVGAHGIIMVLASSAR